MDHIENKYEFTDETIEELGHTLYRIRAVRDFGSVKKGDLGGFIQKEENLSHEGDCWVGGDARVFSDARVFEGAQVYDQACVGTNAKVFGNARVYHSAKIYDTASVSDNAQIFGNSMICDDARVYENSMVYDDAVVFDYAFLFGNSKIFRYAQVGGKALICGDAQVCHLSDYIVFKNWWSSGRYFTWTRSNNKWKVGCFYGTGEQLINAAYMNSEISGREYERVVKYVESITW